MTASQGPDGIRGGAAAPAPAPAPVPAEPAAVVDQQAV